MDVNYKFGSIQPWGSNSTFLQQCCVEESPVLFHCTSVSCTLFASLCGPNVFFNQHIATRLSSPYQHPLRNCHQAHHPKPQESLDPLHHLAYVSPALLITHVQNFNSTRGRMTGGESQKVSIFEHNWTKFVQVRKFLCLDVSCNALNVVYIVWLEWLGRLLGWGCKVCGWMLLFGKGLRIGCSFDKGIETRVVLVQ